MASVGWRASFPLVASDHRHYQYSKGKEGQVIFSEKKNLKNSIYIQKKNPDWHIYKLFMTVTLLTSLGQRNSLFTLRRAQKKSC